HNVIRDLVALDVDVASLLPTDPATFGLDNIGDALSVSPALIERYLSAARKISRLAVGSQAPAAAVEKYRVSNKTKQDVHLGDGFAFGSRGGMLVRRYFPVDAEYEIKVNLALDSDEVTIGIAEPHQIDLRLDGVLLKRFSMG